MILTGRQEIGLRVSDTNMRGARYPRPMASIVRMQNYDVVLIGAGIMSTTVATMLTELEPEWSIGIFERLDRAGKEASEAWNNAGTGHAALCELNYTPRDDRGEISTTKALAINEQFQLSRQLWSYWVEQRTLEHPSSFINPIPHMSFAWGEKGARYLRERYEQMRPEPVFTHLEHTEDPAVIEQWAPLLMRGRTDDKRVAASRARGGTDIDFGEMTRQLADHLARRRADVRYRHRVTSLRRERAGWRLQITDSATSKRANVQARHVFVGAGGGTLPLLQSAKLPAVRGYSGFPVAGQFLRTTDPETAAHHYAKVYGLPGPGAPPMSVPHLDTRFVSGRRTLMFGPYAGFSMKYLKYGPHSALLNSLRPHNVGPMFDVAGDRRDFVLFLLRELAKNKRAKTAQLLDYYPQADPRSWELITAGQRVQVVKPGPYSPTKRRRGVMELFGTELITSADGSLAGLLGASPGASTAPEIALRVLSTTYPDHVPRWRATLQGMVPSYGRRLNDDVGLLDEMTSWTNRVLELTDPGRDSADVKAV